MRRAGLAMLLVLAAAGTGEAGSWAMGAASDRAAAAAPRAGADASTAGCPTPEGSVVAAPAAAPFRPAPRFVPELGLKRVDLATAYEIQPLYDVEGLDGAGQTVAIMSWDTFSDETVTAFDAATGRTGPKVQRHRLADAASTPGANSNEVTLDIEVIRTIAPAAQIVDYESCRGSNADLVNAILEDGKASTISLSWGLCEQDRANVDMAFDELAFKKAAAAGISAFVASGDDGAYDCRRDPTRRRGATGRERDFRVSVDYPASSSWLTAVGGTTLAVGTDGSYVREAGWEDPLTQFGGGGGVSTLFERPAWQVGMGSQTDASGKRQLPDVAGPAAADSGIYMVSANDGCDPTQPACWLEWTADGTSQATPFWAGITVLAAQLAERDGLGRIGPLAPRLYRLANSAAYADLFHDVTLGGNLRDQAATGWDFATGWGTPRVAPLVRALVEDVRAHPTQITSGS